MDFIKLVSAERLQSYRYPNDLDNSIGISRYLANVALCSAFYVPLHVVEIGLRNSLYIAIEQRYGKDWIMTDLLHEREQKSINAGITELNKRHEPQTSGKIIAELTFGFWASLLYQKYDAPSFKISGKAVFWPFCLKDAFPYLPNTQRTRKFAEKKIENIRRFRNRVFHHEPIFKLNLLKKHEEIKEVISWFYQDYENKFYFDNVRNEIDKYKKYL